MHNRPARIVMLGCMVLGLSIVALNWANEIEPGVKAVAANSIRHELSQPVELAEDGISEVVEFKNAGLRRTDAPVEIANPDRSASSVPATPRMIEQVQLVTYTSDESDGFKEKSKSPSHWPIADSLVVQIKAIRNVPEVRNWADETIALLEAMGDADPGTMQLDICLNQIELQVRAVTQLAATIGQRSTTSSAAMLEHCEVSRLAYRLQRRLAVWRALRNTSLQPTQNQVGVLHSFGSGSTTVPASFSRINLINLNPNWIEYLKLDQLKSAFESLNPNVADQKKAARDVLARIYSPVLKPDQAEYIQQVIDPMTVSLLRKHASDAIDHAELLKRIERYETQNSSLTAYYLNDQYQNLLWSKDPADQAVANELQTHYRNANFRLVVSERLLNRMIPELPTTASPVSQTIKGAQVSGQSQVSNQLYVDLKPSTDRIRLELATSGDVRSDTIAKTRSFRIQNFGKAQFQVVQRLEINPMSIEASSRPTAMSKANQYVVGVESKLDNVPILGRVARNLAAKKLREEAPETDRLFKRTVETEAETLMQEEVERQVSEIKQTVYTKLFKPLLAMELEPESLQMASTDHQVVMRYRLAGRDQMAANTSRPRDSGESLLSCQIHQTAINNSIARIGLNGNHFTVDELRDHLRKTVGGYQFGNPTQEKDEQYAEIGFAYLDPIHVNFDEDRLNITLNLRSLKIGEKGKVWKNISLTASYQFALDGMSIQLLQDDDGTRIKGKKRLRFSDKAAISAVMKVLFQQQYAFNAMPPQIGDRIGGQLVEVSQLVVSDGWMGISYDDIPTIAAQNERHDHQQSRGGRRLLQRR